MYIRLWMCLSQKYYAIWIATNINAIIIFWYKTDILAWLLLSVRIRSWLIFCVFKDFLDRSWLHLIQNVLLNSMMICCNEDVFWPHFHNSSFYAFPNHRVMWCLGPRHVLKIGQDCFNCPIIIRQTKYNLSNWTNFFGTRWTR